MNGFLEAVVGFFAAIIGSMGLGGGGVLLMYISAFTSTDQLKAQGINLLFFLPIGVVSVFFHIKNRLINKKAALFTILTAVPGAVLGSFLSGAVDQNLLRKALAIFLFILGAREFVSSFKKQQKRS